jgi:hypothetical protein
MSLAASYYSKRAYRARLSPENQSDQTLAAPDLQLLESIQEQSGKIRSLLPAPAPDPIPHLPFVRVGSLFPIVRTACARADTIRMYRQSPFILYQPLILTSQYPLEPSAEALLVEERGSR